MKRTAVFLLAVLSAVLLPSPTRGAAGKQHILWAVENKAVTVYLMGSIHLLKPESYPLDDVMEEAYSRSATVAFETDLNEINSPGHVGRLMSLGLYFDGRSIADDISEETFAMLVERTRLLGRPLAEFTVMKPWFCGLSLYLVTLKQQGLAPNYGLDAHFYLRALLDGKKTVFLESAGFQVDLMAHLAAGDQEALLRQALLDEGLFDSGIDGLYRAWEEGDAEGLASSMAESMDTYPALKKMFLDDRNRSWIDAIEELLDGTGDSLVIVGAGHLVGEGSVVELLRQRGWQVRQL